jgi:hypothetical protein
MQSRNLPSVNDGLCDLESGVHWLRNTYMAWGVRHAMGLSGHKLLAANFSHIKISQG